MDVIITHNTLSFFLIIVTRCFFKAPWKHCAFSLFTEEDREVHHVRLNIHPRSLLVSFDGTPLSQHVFSKEKIALSPDLNTARWFARMDLSASVQKQQGRLSASAVKHEIVMPWKWTIQAFWLNVFRVQIALYVENRAAIIFFESGNLKEKSRTLKLEAFVCFC